MMKKIAILTCLKSISSVCTGASCFSAVNERRGAFAEYENEDINVVAFFQCNGCNSSYCSDAGMIEKVERIIKIKPDVVHIGKCVKKVNGIYCDNIKSIISELEKNHIKCVDGTH